jgi:ketosteroid isomerase-like protein
MGILGTMSEENVRLVRRAYESLNRGDVEPIVEFCDEDFVLDMSQRVFNPNVYDGHDGIRRFYRDVMEIWESYQWTVENALASGDDVVAMLRCVGRGRGSGLEVNWRVAWIWSFRNGRGKSLRFYRDRDQALEAAGLSGDGTGDRRPLGPP